MSYAEWIEYTKSVCISCELIVMKSGQYIDHEGLIHNQLTDNIIISNGICEQCIQRINPELYENMKLREILDTALKELMLD